MLNFVNFVCSRIWTKLSGVTLTIESSPMLLRIIHLYSYLFIQNHCTFTVRKATTWYLNLVVRNRETTGIVLTFLSYLVHIPTSNLQHRDVTSSLSSSYSAEKSSSLYYQYRVVLSTTDVREGRFVYVSDSVGLVQELKWRKNTALFTCSFFFHCWWKEPCWDVPKTGTARCSHELVRDLTM